jgi:HD-like signal output (HDOD) protein
VQNYSHVITTASDVTAPSSDIAVAKTDNLMEALCNHSDLPTFGSSVSRLVKLSSSHNGTIQELAQFVLSDVSLTQKILRLSNSANVRSVSAQEVTSISKAIHLLGLNTVKACALAIILVDKMPGKKAQCVRNELAHALTASVIGRELANRIHFKDAEEVAIAALFKNIGRLLVAAYDENLYARIMVPVKAGVQTPSQASKQALGCSFDKLTETALKKWQIPDAIIQAMKLLSPKSLTSLKTRQEWMRQAVNFSEAVAPRILAVGKQDNEGQTNEALIARFGKSLHLDKPSLGQLFINAEKNTQVLMKNTNLQYQIDTTNKNHVNSTPSKHISMKPAEPAKQIAGHDDKGGPSVSKIHASGKPLNTIEILTAGNKNTARLITSKNFNNKDLITLFIRTIHDGLGFRFATVCLRNAKTRQFQSYSAMGENHIARQKAFFFPMSSSHDLFHLVMKKEVDLFISNASDRKIHDLIPTWHHALLPDARSFIVLPLVKHKIPIGLLYADRKLEAPEGISSVEKTLIKRLKEQVITALR